jgi:hypothetical protein
MSIELDQFANITVIADGSPIKKQSFGTLAILVGENAASVAVTTYTKASDVGTAFGTDSEAYRCALRAFSQQPRPKRVKVIAANAGVTHRFTITVSAATDGTVTSLTILKADGTTASFTHTASSNTTTQIATAVAALIDADADLAATSLNAVITVTGATAGEFNYITASTNLITYVDTTADPGYATVLNTAITTDNDWYGLVVDAGSSAVVTAVAAWAEANGKIYCPQLTNAAELTSGGTIGAALKTSAYDRTLPIFHRCKYASERADAAWVALMLTYSAGRANWRGKTLRGVTADGLSSTEIGYLEGDNINYYDAVADRNVTMQGKLSSGEWIDIIHGRDSLVTDLQNAVATLTLNAPKLPYTQPGIDAVVAEGKGVLQKYAAGVYPFLRPGTIEGSGPDIDDVSDADFAARELNDVVFTAEYAGAINTTNMQLTLSVG